MDDEGLGFQDIRVLYELPEIRSSLSVAPLRPLVLLIVPATTLPQKSSSASRFREWAMLDMSGDVGGMS